MIWQSKCATGLGTLWITLSDKNGEILYTEPDRQGFFFAQDRYETGSERI